MKPIFTPLIIAGYLILFTNPNALANPPSAEAFTSMDLTNPWLLSEADPSQLLISADKNLGASDKDTDLLADPQKQEMLDEEPGAPEDALDDSDNSDPEDD